ncbi:MAG: sortase [Actinomycetota bacterium]|nr:sortase [Actinomycetota bacterium]
MPKSGKKNSIESNQKLETASKLRRKISNLLIIFGIITIAFPFITEAYGYFTARQLSRDWDLQASEQKEQAKKLQERQDRLILKGQLPREEEIISNLHTNKGLAKSKSKEKRKPFPKTKIIIPKIGVNQVVLEGTSPDILKLGPGHYIGTANPGDRGNVGIAGHRVTYTHPFNRLDELVRGDLIILETIDYQYEYRVENMLVVDPKNVSTLMPTADPRVTLTTCNPKYSARTRLNVVGVLVSSKPKHIDVIRAVKQIINKKEKNGTPKSKVKSLEQLRQDLVKAKAMIEKNPLDEHAYIMLSETYLALNRYAEAYRALKKAELIRPDSTDVERLSKEISKIKEGLWQKIRAHEGKSSEYAEISPIPYLDLGNLYIAEGKYKEAAGIFERGKSIFYFATDMYVQGAKVYEKLGRDDLAIENYNNALTYDPNCKEAIAGIKRLKNKKPTNGLDINNMPYRLQPQ